MVILVGQ